MVLHKNLIATNVETSLVSTSNLTLDGISFTGNLEALNTKLQNQSAVSGTTTFTGTLAVSKFTGLNSVTTATTNTSSLYPKTGSTITCSGSITVSNGTTCTSLSCATNSNTNYTAFNFIQPTLYTGSGYFFDFLFGKAPYYYNSGRLSWDNDNNRCVLGVASSSTQIQISSSLVNFANGLINSVGEHYRGYRIAGPKTWSSLAGGSYTPEIAIPITNVKEIIVMIKDVYVNLSNLNNIGRLQVGQGSTWMTSTSGVYTGRTDGPYPYAWDVTGIATTNKYITTKGNTTIYLTYLDTPVGLGQLWAVRLLYSGFQMCSSGAGFIQMPSNYPNLNNIRIYLTTPSQLLSTGTYQVMYA